MNFHTQQKRTKFATLINQSLSLSATNNLKLSLFRQTALFTFTVITKAEQLFSPPSLMLNIPNYNLVRQFHPPNPPPNFKVCFGRSTDVFFSQFSLSKQAQVCVWKFPDISINENYGCRSYQE
jgi:hypothetical protein